ncbi:hypothetical protein [Marinobacter zhanjiangensis]|nr:hypothetical protein [Marinobacter zhanjiangensis]
MAYKEPIVPVSNILLVMANPLFVHEHFSRQSTKATYYHASKHVVPGE